MNKKGLYWLLGLMAVVVLVITTFARKGSNPDTDQAVAPVGNETTATDAQENTEETAGKADEDKGTYLANIDAKIAELRMTLDSYRSRNTDDSLAPALTELDAQLTNLASSVEQARANTGAEWQTARLQIDEQYTEVVQHFNEVISQNQSPASTSGEGASVSPIVPDAQTHPADATAPVDSTDGAITTPTNAAE